MWKWDEGREMINDVKKMDNIYELDWTEFPKEEENTLIKRVTEYYENNYNGFVERDDIGKVILDEDSVKASVWHKVRRNKAISFKAVPEVIKKWKIVWWSKNRKGRWYDSYLIAAPITIKWDRYLCFVRINSEWGENRYYLHNVVLENLTK